MMKYSLDLEMNQPSGGIIQIGACVFDDSGVLDTFSRYIKINEPLSQEIIELTGITDVDVYTGVSLEEAYSDLVKFTEKCDKQAVVWGEGDMRVLREQLPDHVKWMHGWRTIDVKTLHQFLGPIRGISSIGGLKKTLGKYGLNFKGRPHSAEWDAYNTAILYNKIKEIQINCYKNQK